jgi:dihydroflavonol-4-reductase
MSERVLLTGITGYIGEHIAVELIKQGYEVVGTFRSLKKAEASRESISKFVSTDRLSFVKADLLSDDGWSEAMKGCTFVLHVASPFFMIEPKNEMEIISPAIEGTKRVIKEAKRANIKRVVLTSSIVAMVAGKKTGRYGSDSWSDCNLNIGAYSKSKTLAELEAWKELKDSKVELTVINPGGVFGPSIGAKAEAQNIKMISDIISGKIPMIPDVAMGMVDVRDVAKLHVNALKAEGAAGRRFIAASAEPVEMVTVMQILKEAGYEKVPSLMAPSFMLKFMSIFDREAKGMVPFLGKKASFDNQATFDLLDWKPIPIEISIKEMAKALSK